MSAIVPGLIVLALVLVNGLFVAAEFAIVGAPRTTLERKAAEGSRAARRVSDILRDPRNQDRYIATAQIGITFASLGLGMYGEHQLAHWIDERLVTWDGLPGWVAVHSLATVLAIALLTYVHIVFGEMVPKSLALQHAERTALGVTPVMVWFRRLVYPLVLGLNAIGNGILRLAGIDRSEGSQDHYYSAEELEFAVEESLGAGLINRGSGRVLHELFDLGARSAEDVMAPRVQVHGIDEHATTDEMRALILEHTHTRYPVYREDIDDIIGVVHVRDLAALVFTGDPLAPEHIREVPYVPESTPLDVVVNRMRAQSIQFAVVLDEHGGTAGIITPDDVTAELLGQVREGTGPGEIFVDAAQRLHVAGTVRLDELSERLQRSVTHDEVETVSGLILAYLQRPPQVGDTVLHQGLLFQVNLVDGRGVSNAVVSTVEAPEPPESE